MRKSAVSIKLPEVVSVFCNGKLVNIRPTVPAHVILRNVAVLNEVKELERSFVSLRTGSESL